MIQDRQLLGLGTAALALLILTVAVHSVDTGRERTFQRTMPLVQGLDIDAVDGIVVERGGTEVHLLRRGGVFQIQELESYPADVDALNALLLNVLGARAAERLGAGDGAAETFGLAGDGADPVRVRLLGRDGKPLAGLELGQPAERGTAVRRVGREEVFATETPLAIEAAAMAYVRRDLTDILRSDLRRVTVNAPGTEPFDIVMETPQDGTGTGRPQPRLATVKDGELADPEALDRLVDALRSLRFESPRHALASGEIDWTWEYRLVTDDVTYRVRLGDADDILVCAVSAEGPSDMAIQDGLRRVRSANAEASMKQVDGLIQARERAEVYTRRHASWVYLLPEGQLSRLQGGRAALLQDPDAPTSIQARHILVAYQGAERSEVDRTREEAEALAAELLTKLQAEGADFGALAGTYSDDPGSRAVQGDLGVFGRGTMAEAFDAAAFSLGVREVSGIVETPFGFHIIQRTE